MDKNYSDFMGAYAQDRPVVHVVLGNSIELTMPGKAQRSVANLDKIDKQPFIVIHDTGSRKMLLDPIIIRGQRLPSPDHLCVDAHGFYSPHDAAMIGVGGWHGEVGTTELRPTGYTSHGWNATGTVALLIGKQEITDKPETISDVVEDLARQVSGGGTDLDLVPFIKRLRKAR